MNINIKPAALAKLSEIDFKDNQGFRIEAIFIGSCSIYAEHHLRIDQRRQDDDFFEIEGIPVLVSKESQKHLHHRLTLDYNPSLGYKLSSDEEVYGYNLELKRQND